MKSISTEQYNKALSVLTNTIAEYSAEILKAEKCKEWSQNSNWIKLQNLSIEMITERRDVIRDELKALQSLSSRLDKLTTFEHGTIVCHLD